MRNRAPKILIYPDPRLKRVAEPVNFEDTTIEERTKIVMQMGAALAKTGYGMKLGLAAPQIGLNKRIAIVQGNVMFNPEWEPTKAPPNMVTEGCYSVPGKTFRVSRVPYGHVKWTSIDGRKMENRIKDLNAIVFQHELDHLNGLCIADIGKENET